MLVRVALGIALAVAASALAGCDGNPDVNGDEIAPLPAASAKKKAKTTKADDETTDVATTEASHGDTAPTPAGDPTAASDLPPAEPIPVTTPAVTTPAVTTPPVTTPQTIAAPSSITVKWNKKSDTAEYSFDLITKANVLIGPCINSLTVKKNLSQKYTGTCTDQGQNVAIEDVGQVRVCWTEGGDWSKASCAAALYDGVSSEVMIDN